MKANFFSIKSVVSAICLAFAIGGLALITSCGGGDEDCTGCTAASPWSHPNGNACYATQAACEQAEGGTCVICN